LCIFTEGEIKSSIRFDAFFFCFIALFVLYVSEFSERRRFVIIQRLHFPKDGQGEQANYEFHWMDLENYFLAWLVFRATISSLKKGNGKTHTLE